MHKSTKQAIHLCQFAHAGQTYGDQDYFYHLDGVAKKVVMMVGAEDVGTETLKQVAYLHDILEDTTVSEEFLTEHFDARVVVAVKLLTKFPGYNHEQYINEIKRNQIARMVKIADTLFNLEQSVMYNSKRRVEKYSTQLKQLMEP